jgi:hypothetical protein
VRDIKLLAGISLALALAPAALDAQTVRDGIIAWQKQDYTTAVAIWRPLAEKGDPDAAFNLGQALRLGRGARTDLAAAQLWLERAARAGHLDAQTTLGLLLLDSNDRIGAMRWLKPAAERGEPRALLLYGTALFNGDGVPSDPVLAYAYVSRAAAQGLEPAKSTLADLDRIIPLPDRKKGVALALAATAKTKAPRPTARTAAKAPSATSGPWRIQLGAFAKRSSAEALYQRLSGLPALAGRRPFLLPAGAVTRLQVGPFASRQQAASACAALYARAQACFPVAGR